MQYKKLLEGIFTMGGSANTKDKRNLVINSKKIYRPDYLNRPMDDEKKLFSEMEAVRQAHLFAKMDAYFSTRRNITLVNTVKNEESYLLEWIAYHQEIGVDGFVIMDNGSTDSTPQFLQKLDDAGVICYAPWPTAHQYEKQQIAAYVAVMDHLQKHDYSEWVGLIDPDEFIAVKHHTTLLEAIPDCDAMFMHWAFFGSAGLAEREPGLVIDRFTKKAPVHHFRNRSGKFLARVSQISGHFHHMHDIVIADASRYRYPDGSKFEGRVVEMSDWPGRKVIEARHENVSLHHYAVKSLAEFEEKKSKGRGNYRPDEGHDKLNVSMIYFKSHDFNNEEDNFMLQHSKAVTNRIAQLEKLLETR